MQSFVAQARGVGDQIIITIPKEIIAAEQICVDAFVKVTVQKIQQQTASTHKSDDSLGPDDPWKLLE
ncbi:MAG: hypothetical protein M1490_06395 [Candidatus Bathyarchaeota archaeon]|nr:hypothetical protein [Candidatus Bathyarchaeota archaeon]